MIGGKRRFLAFFVFILCSVGLFAACVPVDRVVSFFADDGTGHIFRIAIPKNPENLDPQLASDEESVMISKNLYKGLMEIDGSGRLSTAIASDYDISPDGLTYTFYIDEGYSWYAAGGFTAPVTAYDFEFAFRRLMDPKTDSPHSEEYYCIAEAAAARSGAIPPEEIGVHADGDGTVIFTLERKCSEFLYLLAELPAMPCCEEFFNSEAGGKYGLEAESTCSNGPFYIRYWLHDPYGSDNYVRLRRNPEYSEKSYVSPAGVNYLVNPDYEDREKDFTDETTEMMIYSPGQRPDSTNNCITGYAVTAGLIFNSNSKAFSDKEVRQVFSWASDREAARVGAPEILKDAYGIVPDDPRISSKGYIVQQKSEITESNPQLAEYKWSFMLDDSKKSEFIGMTLMVPESFEYSETLDTLTECWYDAIKIHFAIELVNDRDYNSRIKSGDYDIALAFIGSNTASPYDYISPFGADKTFGFSVSGAAELMRSKDGYESLSALNYACSEAETAVLSEYRFIPLWYLPTVLKYNEDAEGLALDPFTKTVYFENAKMF